MGWSCPAAAISIRSPMERNPDPANHGIRPKSDLFEIALVLEAKEQSIPVLGICRGLQIVNVAFGGTLHQDLPDHPQDLAGGAFAGHYRTTVPVLGCGGSWIPTN